MDTVDTIVWEPILYLRGSFQKKVPKSGAERTREWRERRRANEPPKEPKKRKSRLERVREFRARKKAELLSSAAVSQSVNNIPNVPLPTVEPSTTIPDLTDNDVVVKKETEDDLENTMHKDSSDTSNIDAEETLTDGRLFSLVKCEIDELPTNQDTYNESLSSETNSLEEQFNQLSNLNEHEGLHKCAYCDRTFQTRKGLLHHRISHSEYRPFTCDICGKSFKQNVNLKTHLETHSGIKPYKCEICNQLFQWKHNLKAHMDGHSGSRPHQCLICSKSFKRKSHLAYHITIHNKSEIYQCGFCDRSFMNRSSLSNHTNMHVRNASL